MMTAGSSAPVSAGVKSADALFSACQKERAAACLLLRRCPVDVDVEDVAQCWQRVADFVDFLCAGVVGDQCDCAAVAEAVLDRVDAE